MIKQAVDLKKRGPFDAQRALREAVNRLTDDWLTGGPPSRQTLDQAAKEIVRLRARLNVNGVWQDPPSMLTATLDDAIGQGLEVIEMFAAAIGMRLTRLGLMQSPAAVIDACRRHHPDYLGLTILQFDTEDDLLFIAGRLPDHTRIVAGGPVFAGDPEFAGRTGIHYAAKNVADFLRFMLHTGT
ncbi:MAG: hypothetical protein WBY88_13100 [Desulfosarcina sp.]